MPVRDNVWAVLRDGVDVDTHVLPPIEQFVCQGGEEGRVRASSPAGWECDRIRQNRFTDRAASNTELA